MQRIYACELSPEDYLESEGHRQVVPESVCPRCGGRDGLRRHGTYPRWMTGTIGQLLRMLVARFLCLACRRTISYLPSFALSYRPVRAASFEAFLDGRRERDVQAWEDLLRTYRRRMSRFWPQIRGTVGHGFGRAPPAEAGPWPWLKEACGGLASAARQLVTLFRIALFTCYQCHQPAAARPPD